MESGRLIGALATGALAQFLLAGLFPLSLAASRGQLGLTFISKLLDAAEFDCRQNSRQSSVSPVKVPRSGQGSQVMSRFPGHVSIKPSWMLASSDVTG